MKIVGKKEGETRVDVRSIAARCRVSAQGMSAHNPNKNLLMNCAYTMEQLLDEIGRLNRLMASPAIPLPVRELPPVSKEGTSGADVSDSTS